MAKLGLTLLGGFQARLGSGPAFTLPTRKAQALLAYLALPLGQAHPREKLAALLWGGIREESARASLRQALFAIRRVLGMDPLTVLRQEGDLVALSPAAVELDVADFERAVATGSAESLALAAEVYRGDLLAGFGVDEGPFEEWLLGERERLRELALEGFAKLLAQQRRGGAATAAVQTALKLLALDPLQEPVHRTLMRLYADLGRRGTALRQYQQCVAVLQRELGIEPEAQTKHLYEEILRQKVSRTVERQPVVGHVAETELIGRATEMAQLRVALDGANSGIGRVVAVIGEAGVGKSRVVADLVSEAAGRGMTVLPGRAFESEKILPFGPWVDALRAGRVADDAASLARLDSTLRSELARLLPEIGEVPTTAAGPTDVRPIFESVTQLIGRLADRRPLLVVLEDLHWADEMSSRLLAFLGRRLADRPVVVAVTAREEEMTDAPALQQALDDLRRDARLTMLTLRPLSRPDILALVRALARGDESALGRLGQRVWDASAGNPLMAVETLRALREGAAESVVPERVREVVTRRLDRLSEPAQHIASVAAVIGREFEFPLLAFAASRDEETAAGAVEELVRRRILQAVGERFDFTHDRVREVVASQILLPRWKLIHRRVAEAIEALYAAERDSQALTLARHYREAGVWESAVTSFRQAAAYAMARAGYREAVACLEAALDAAGRVAGGREATERAVDIRFELRTALYPLGEFERTLAYLREAKPLAEQLGDERRLGRVSAYLCVAFRRLGDFESAIAAGERTLSLAAAIDDLSLQVATTLYLGQALWFAGAGRRAVEVLRRNVDSLTSDQLRQRFGAPGYPGVFSMTDMASFLAELGEFAEAKAVGTLGLRVAEELAHPFTEIAARLAMANVSVCGGEFASAIAELERTLALCERGDFPVQRISAVARLGYAYVCSGRLAEGLVLLEEGARDVDRIDGFWRPRFLGWLAEGYLLAGRVEDAHRVAERAQALTPEKAPGVRAWMLRLAAEAASCGDHVDAERAAQHYREAATLAAALDLGLLRAHCHLGLGRLYRSAGDSRARSELSAARDAFRTIGSAHWLAIAESELLTT